MLFFAGMQGIPTVVLVQHMPTSRLIPLLRKSFGFHLFFSLHLKKALSYLTFPSEEWTDLSLDRRKYSAGGVPFVNRVSEIKSCCPSVVGCSSWDLHTMCPSPAVPCHRQRSIEHLSMTWESTRRVFNVFTHEFVTVTVFCVRVCCSTSDFNTC